MTLWQEKPNFKVDSTRCITLIGKEFKNLREEVDMCFQKLKALDVSSGQMDVSVSPVSAGPNLDIHLELRNDGGGLILADDPSDAPQASLSRTLSAGRYFLHVSSNGDYGRLGRYSLSGTYVSSTKTPNAPGNVRLRP